MSKDTTPSNCQQDKVVVTGLMWSDVAQTPYLPPFVNDVTRTQEGDLVNKLDVSVSDHAQRPCLYNINSHPLIRC